MAKAIKVEGLEALLKQFDGLPQEILEAANKASIDAMGPALQSVKLSNRFSDRGRTNNSKNNTAHAPGYLRSVFKTFFITTIRKGKTRAWVSIGVPADARAAYYMPLSIGHKNRDGSKTPGRKFLEDAYLLAEPNATTKITAAINGVLAKYPPEPIK